MYMKLEDRIRQGVTRCSCNEHDNMYNSLLTEN